MKKLLAIITIALVGLYIYWCVMVWSCRLVVWLGTQAACLP
jgi:hypothetical protein